MRIDKSQNYSYLYNIPNTYILLYCGNDIIYSTYIFSYIL